MSPIFSVFIDLMTSSKQKMGISLLPRRRGCPDTCTLKSLDFRFFLNSNFHSRQIKYKYVKHHQDLRRRKRNKYVCKSSLQAFSPSISFACFPIKYFACFPQINLSLPVCLLISNFRLNLSFLNYEVASL